MSRQNYNSLLLPRTYLVSNYLTAADVALYGALHPFFVRYLDLSLRAFGDTEIHLGQTPTP